MFDHLYPPELADKVLPIKKLYYPGPPYNGFAFKIVLICNGFGQILHNDVMIDAVSTHRIKDFNIWLRKTFKQKYEFPSSLKERDGIHQTIFLKDYSKFEEALQLFGDIIKQAERPIDKDHYQMLIAGDKLLFRSQYFWGKYQYKVGLRSSPDLRGEHIPWLMNFFADRPDDDYKFNSVVQREVNPTTKGINIFRYGAIYNRGNRKHYYYGHNVFLSNKEDVMILKLKIGKDIDFVERIIRFKDLNKRATMLENN